MPICEFLAPPRDALIRAEEGIAYMLRHWLLTHGMTLSSYLGYPVGKALRLLRKSQHWTREEIQAHQQRALNALMHHCYSHDPYYRDLMRARNVRPDDFQ